MSAERNKPISLNDAAEENSLKYTEGGDDFYYA